MFKIIHPNRWFFWAIAVAVGTALALLLFIFQAQNYFDNQASELLLPLNFTWKTYHSKILGLMVRYPPFWQIEFDPVISDMVALENPNNFQENISIYAIEPKFEKAIREALEVSSERPITVDGKVGKLLSGRNPKDHAISHVVLVRVKNKLYYIGGYSNNFEKVVASIKFLNN